jgi:HEAT repeat protein
MPDLNTWFQDPRSSVRLQAALAAGTAADPADLSALLERCAVEPDFFVRDMLTWAITRLPPAQTMPAVAAELDRDLAQARSQALHTLSKIGDRRAFPMVSHLISDPVDEVSQAAWRAAVVLVPADRRTELGEQLLSQLGRSGEELQLSLGRAFLGLGEEICAPLLQQAVDAPQRSESARTHAAATLRLFHDPDGAFDSALEAARREVALGRTRRTQGVPPE